MRSELSNRMISEIRTSPLWGDFGGRGWEWIGNWFLLGGLFMIWRGVIIGESRRPCSAGWSWSPACSGRSTGDAPVPGFPCVQRRRDPRRLRRHRPGVREHDPARPVGLRRLIGLLVFIIRTQGGYPDAVAFAVLLMNMAAPTIDYYTQPRIVGQREDGDA